MSIVGFLETIAVGGKFANAARYEYEPNQDLLLLLVLLLMQTSNNDYCNYRYYQPRGVIIPPE